jgi:DNA-binding transcriptional ArsR family regulator
MALLGPLRVYRAPGSVAFLNCQSVIQPILPKSRAWCVDTDSSKFILQMRRPLYWRIELPAEDENLHQKLQEFRDTLDQILLFEKTPCPFSRTFTVVLPEAPKTPVKKKPWKPVLKPSPETPAILPSEVEEPKVEVLPKIKQFPVITGDFLTYKKQEAVSVKVEVTISNIEAAISEETRNNKMSDTAASKHLLADGELLLHTNEETPKVDDSVLEDNTPVSSENDTSLKKDSLGKEEIVQSSRGTRPVDNGNQSQREMPLSDEDQTRTTTDEQSLSANDLSVESGESVAENFETSLPPLPDSPLEAESLDIESPIQKSSEDDYYTAVSDDNFGAPGLDTDSDATDDTNTTPRHYYPPSLPLRVLDQEDHRPEVLHTGRSITAPPQLSILTSPPSKRRSLGSPYEKRAEDSANSDFSSSVDSFHSVQSWHSPITPLPPSPPQSQLTTPTMYPYPHDTIKLPKKIHHNHNVSEATITPETPRPRQSTRRESAGGRTPLPFSSPEPKTPTPIKRITHDLVEEHFEIAPPPSGRRFSRKASRHEPSPDEDFEGFTSTRHTTRSTTVSHRRALSPLPAAINLYSPKKRRPRRHQTARHLPTAIIQKTWEILVSPPSHLFNIMLEIAAKISAGTWKGVVFGEGDEELAWDYEGECDFDDGTFVGDWAEDDFGFSLKGRREVRRRMEEAVSEERRGRIDGGSWEVD